MPLRSRDYRCPGCGDIVCANGVVIRSKKLTTLTPVLGGREEGAVSHVEVP